jgi:hypothetical protein
MSVHTKLVNYQVYKGYQGDESKSMNPTVFHAVKEQCLPSEEYLM